MLCICATGKRTKWELRWFLNYDSFVRTKREPTHFSCANIFEYSLSHLFSLFSLTRAAACLSYTFDIYQNAVQCVCDEYSFIAYACTASASIPFSVWNVKALHDTPRMVRLVGRLVVVCRSQIFLYYAVMKIILIWNFLIVFLLSQIIIRLAMSNQSTIIKSFRRHIQNGLNIPAFLSMRFVYLYISAVCTAFDVRSHVLVSSMKRKRKYLNFFRCALWFAHRSAHVGAVVSFAVVLVFILPFRRTSIQIQFWLARMDEQ